MGFVRKITGVEKQIKATNKNAAAQEAATKQAANAQAAALAASAKAAAENQAMLAARSAAEEAAAEVAATPLEEADVQLDPATTESTAASRARRKASYGRNYTGGVSI